MKTYFVAEAYQELSPRPTRILANYDGAFSRF